MPLPAHLRRLAAAAAALLATACGGVPFESAMTMHDRADEAVEAWVRRHPAEWRLELATATPLVRPAWSPPCAANPPSGFVTVRHETGDTEIDLAFRCPVDAGGGAAALQARFAFAVLQRLPHGIAAPGWSFRVLTPSSSVSSGVTFADARNGRVLVTIDAPLYAVHGQRAGADCEPPADAPMPAGCFVHREHRVPLRLTLLAPIVSPGAP